MEEGELTSQRRGTFGKGFLEEVALGVEGWWEEQMVDGWACVFLKAGCPHSAPSPGPSARKMFPLWLMGLTVQSSGGQEEEERTPRMRRAQGS